LGSERLMKNLGLTILLASFLSYPVIAEEPIGHGGHAKVKAAKKAEPKHVTPKAEPKKHEEEKHESAKHVDAKPQAHTVHWSYEGEHGAEHWGDIAGNETCKLGKVQTPINIMTRSVESAPISPIRFNYTMSNGEVINNGHTLQVNFKPGNSIDVDGTNYALLQFHFHAPSEEGFDNIRYPMVAHFVHKSAEGRLAVVALLFTVGNENQILKNVFAKFPPHEGQKADIPNLDLGRIFNGSQKYYSFMGSLTTPPCSEGVKWHVLKTSQEISLNQLIDFKSLYPENARPFQPINNREIRVSE